MNVAVNGFVPYKIRTSLIKITSYADKQLRGTLCNPYFEHEMRFDNAVQFLMLMEELLNSLGYPQKAMEARCFRSAAPCPVCEPLPGGADEAVLASFKLTVLFRQNASWQGQLIWLDRKCETQFRSVLELLMLIDNVLA